jgi:hypothetical protein
LDAEPLAISIMVFFLSRLAAFPGNRQNILVYSSPYNILKLGRMETNKMGSSSNIKKQAAHFSILQ